MFIYARVLLDEVNLASAETLECVASILQGPHGSVTLTEAGQLEPVPRHPDFRLFACMNPATDAGKKDLPPNIRSRFTELYVPPPDADEDALRSIVTQYIGHCALGDKTAITNVADFYVAAKRLTAARQLADGQNHVPHFSMRTLARALTFASDMRLTLGLRRALWEGVTMAFMMTLDAKSAGLLRAAAEKTILEGLKNVPALLSQPVPPPEKDASEKYVQVGSFWLLRGPEPVQSTAEYILTPSVEAKLVDLARIVTTRRFPVLIEGPTSSGKTSSVEYLAKQTGHRFVRINNHEHTDLQEYLGSYLTDPATGKLKFQDGILVRALRAGDWIVLDELNLAPTDVLEALNRLLDDNRELVVPETNEVIRPHPNFMLFATQNPPGLYAGRKVLSRAFRNRFLEVHFDDVPQDELETILCQRCGIAQSHGRKIVAVFQELQKRRQVGRVFETKNSFATLRDLFRWANRHSEGYDENSVGGNYQHLAEQGFMLLAERARRADDRAVVKAVIEDIMKVKIDEWALYDLTASGAQQRIGVPVPTGSSIVWTGAMRRLFTLLSTALRYDEPVLLVGETGSGKTSVCELLALAMGRPLHSLSCHQNTETADLLGSQRPLRNRTALRDTAIIETTELLREMGLISPSTAAGDLDHTVQLVESALKCCLPEQASPLRRTLSSMRRSMALFEWHDGPLIQAMQGGGLFLLDEISLADDSVLERLNSVLEPSRTVVLAEKGGSDISHLTVVATSGFQLVATMNPGGDYGKKELSPALRNRFTEIWVPHVEDREDLEQIVQHSWADERLQPYTSKLLDFTEYIGQTLKDKNALGLRDLLVSSGLDLMLAPFDNGYRPGFLFRIFVHLRQLWIWILFL
jgi:midasin